ncbi:MAG: bile acid:sodium symporter [Gammaproteobacteria bacterium]|nr:bile acid:sodium symporter [Gammaproteobacteria bacterium]
MIETSQVYFNPDAQWLLNLVLASMILGVALDIKMQDFRQVAKKPKAIGAGLIAQFILLPATTLLLTLSLDLPAGVELGMMLVAACPGGAISNFVTHLSGGNTALSISMTAIASALSIFMLPFNFLFWSQFNEPASSFLTRIDVNTQGIVISLLFVLAVPLALGLIVKHKFPNSAKKAHKVLNVTSTLALIGFIAIAVIRNQHSFLVYFNLMFAVVLIHNAVAFALGFFAGKLASLNNRDVKATTIEVGMQNSSLALAIIFTQFDGQAGMALISAFWGTWHIVSGLSIALVFRLLMKAQKVDPLNANHPAKHNNQG